MIRLLLNRSISNLLLDTCRVLESEACESQVTDYFFIPITGDERVMPETSVPTPPGFDALSEAEQVRYLQALWDQISEDPGALPVPESHLLLAEDRLKRYR